MTALGTVGKYALRLQIGRGAMGIVYDAFVIGPTAEPPRKVVQALAALGVTIASEFSHIVR